MLNAVARILLIARHRMASIQFIKTSDSTIESRIEKPTRPPNAEEPKPCGRPDVHVVLLAVWRLRLVGYVKARSWNAIYPHKRAAPGFPGKDFDKAVVLPRMR